MKQPLFRRSALAALIALSTVLAACKEEPPPVAQSVQPSAAASTASAAVAPQAQPQPQPINTQASKYTPEALETLLAPVALYPDAVLAQVLASATNPQEVLDAGNWLVAHPNLKGKELTAAIAPLGFTPPTMSLMHFPTVMDMMCLKMEWTTELGSAFLADEPGVLAAVQRLRQQAMEVGNLKDSEQMKVAKDEQNNQQIVTIAPANPDVVYVPQYDPTAVYSAPAAGPTSAPVTTATTTTTVPAATTTTVVDDNDDEYDRGDMVVTGLLAFGAGMLVNEVFNDDDDEGDYYYPRWGSDYPGGYAPYRYNPNYGNGFRPANGYNRPANYQRGSNNNIYINAKGNDYFNKFERGPNNYLRQADSPITAARPQRAELATLEPRSLNNEAGGRRDATPKGTYAGANRQPKSEYAGAPRAVNEVNREARATAPKGSYAGANRQPKSENAKATRDARQVSREANVAQRTPRQGNYAGDKVKRQQITPQTAGARDRGYVQPRATHSKSATQTATRRAPAASKSAFQGVQNSGRTERAASHRGRESVASSAHAGRNTQPRRSTR
ncbi:DUF3300 domain-containing protein [Aeromonas media]|uniref:DUF3300 domain-containing protein n=1 Tax=Aeromonas media TaxID=651 RepID=UPI00143D4816|nr:DUF3300 domain-containing protein [Aeromonas media]MBS4701253.1 DUF3300 domain-containing protein [Aeromonas media]QIY88692.1 DUF3300 domain-containing protein [Aeromonas hydrophila]